MSYEELLNKVRGFNLERDWGQFHTPANLAKSVCIEAGELLECFQWRDDYDLEAVKDEIADVFIYLLDMADSVDVDLIEAANRKLDKSAEKYPVEKARGSCLKYDKL